MIEGAKPPVFEEVLAQLAEESRQEPLPDTDCIIEIGHNIERLRDGRFYPSSLAISVREAGSWSDGAKKYVRTGIKPAGTVKELYQSDEAIAAGGVLEVVACAYLYDVLRSERHIPKLVIHSGGRPGYLDEAAHDQPDMTEAKPMVELFHHRIALSSSTREIMLETGKNTKDDMRDSLTEALKAGCNSAVILSLEMRMPRCWVFVQQVTAENPQLAVIDVKYRSTEEIITLSAQNKGRLPQWEKALHEFKASKPYQRTFNDEKNGFDMAAKGMYAGTGKQ